MQKKRIIGIVLLWVGLISVMVSFSPNLTGFVISNSFVFRGGYFLFVGMILAVIGIFMTTLEEEVEDENQILSKKDKENLYDIATKTVEEIHNNQYNSLVFLDRSARVFNHLIRARWKSRYPHEKIPHVSFVNIGREKWKGETQYYHENFSKMKREYSEKVKKGFDKKYFEGKKILLIDEYKSTGKTERFATEVFKKAFPNSEVKYVSMGDFRPDYSESMHSLAQEYMIPTKDEGNKGIFINPLRKSFFVRKVYSDGYKKYGQLARALKKIGERK